MRLIEDGHMQDSKRPRNHWRMHCKADVTAPQPASFSASSPSSSVAGTSATLRNMKLKPISELSLQQQLPVRGSAVVHWSAPDAPLPGCTGVSAPKNTEKLFFSRVSISIPPSDLRALADVSLWQRRLLRLVGVVAASLGGLWHLQVVQQQARAQGGGGSALKNNLSTVS
jgi:hypothetical protein